VRALVLALALLAGCFKPSPQEGFACFGQERWCPDPLTCQPDGTCRSSPGGGDGGGNDGSGGDGTTGGLANIAFVTSMPFTALSFGSVAEADKKCEDLGMSIGHAGRYVAWLSSSADPVSLRLGNASGWRRVDGKPFAASKGDLLAGNILYPLRKDELGNDVIERVMTGTVADGSASENCVDLTSGSANEFILLGYSYGDIQQWTNGDEGACDVAYRIYCLQADLNTTVMDTPPAGPRAFLSSKFTPGGGITAADTVCKNDGIANGLGTNFKAALATTTASATGRIAVPPSPWVRVDGVATTPDLLSFDGAISVTAAGVHLDEFVFSGAPMPNVVATSGGQNCNNWGNGGSSALIGHSARAVSNEAFGSVTSGCVPTRVYCLGE
jgi:hypothetical protein